MSDLTGVITTWSWSWSWPVSSSSSPSPSSSAASLAPCCPVQEPRGPDHHPPSQQDATLRLRPQVVRLGCSGEPGPGFRWGQEGQGEVRGVICVTASLPALARTMRTISTTGDSTLLPCLLPCPLPPTCTAGCRPLPPGTPSQLTTAGLIPPSPPSRSTRPEPPPPTRPSRPALLQGQ